MTSIERELEIIREKWIKYFDHMFSHSKDLMNLYSLTHRKIIRYNLLAHSAFGYNLEELVRTPIESIYPSEELLKLGAAFERLKVEGVSEESVRLYTKNREIRPAHLRACVLERKPEILCLVQTTVLYNPGETFEIVSKNDASFKTISFQKPKSESRRRSQELL